ncbi:MAG: sensor histidine kinase [Cytophagales bacterium]|nr:MAG: sensor histidine kinase [Cytophagales bacterium]TAF60190.1 MAG: sensor histidine kinase [Cytophagales bacterium]
MAYYPREEKKINAALELLAASEVSESVWRAEYLDLLKHYETLLTEFSFVTKVSDRVYNKMQRVNDELNKQKTDLEHAQKIILQQNLELSTLKIQLEKIIKERTSDLNSAYSNMLTLNKELDGFVYRAAHDLRGPIARLIGLASLAETENTTKDYIPMIKNCAAEMDDILQRLLQTSIVKSHILVFEQIPLGETLNLILEDLRSTRQLEAEVQCLACQNNKVVLTDEFLFVMALKNLITICAKHCQENASGKIAIHVMDTPNSLQIYVSYTDSVIPHAVRDNIFDLFFRFTAHSDGLELYSCKLATEKLGGELSLVSSDQEGTVFAVILPHNWPNAGRRAY